MSTEIKEIIRVKFKAAENVNLYQVIQVSFYMTVFLATHMDCSHRGIITFMNKCPNAFNIIV